MRSFANESARARDGERRTLQKALLPIRLRHSSSALFARGVAYDDGCHRAAGLALRPSVHPSVRTYVRSLAPLLSLPRLAPAAVFSPAIVWRSLFTDTPRVLSDNVRRKSVCPATITALPFVTRDFQRERQVLFANVSLQ